MMKYVIEELTNKLSFYGLILTFVGQILIALVAIIIAIWGDTMKTWIKHPVLEMEIRPYVQRIDNPIQINY